MEGVKLVITGPQGTVRASGVVFPSHPWNPDIVKQTQLMETQTGELLTVTAKPAGEEVIEVASKPVQTRKFTLSGDIDRDVWFDGAGNWIRLSFPRDGATITLTRATPMP